MPLVEVCVLHLPASTTLYRPLFWIGPTPHLGWNSWCLRQQHNTKIQKSHAPTSSWARQPQCCPATVGHRCLCALHACPTNMTCINAQTAIWPLANHKGTRNGLCFVDLPSPIASLTQQKHCYMRVSTGNLSKRLYQACRRRSVKHDGQQSLGIACFQDRESK